MCSLCLCSLQLWSNFFVSYKNWQEININIEKREKLKILIIAPENNDNNEIMIHLYLRKYLLLYIFIYNFFYKVNVLLFDRYHSFIEEIANLFISFSSTFPHFITKFSKL